MACLKNASSDLSSRSSSEEVDVIRLRLAFGGVWKRQDDRFTYVGGETYLEKFPLDVKYAELMYKVNEKTNGASIFKYTYPGEEFSPDNLVTVIDDDHVQEMIEAYHMALSTIETPGRRFRLRVWLSKASEEELLMQQIYLSRSASWTSDTQPSEMSDGTHSPLIRSHLPQFQASETAYNAHLQMRVAQEECIYMNNMEVAEEAQQQRRFRQLQEQWENYSAAHSPSCHTFEQNSDHNDHMMADNSRDAFGDYHAGYLQPTCLQYQTGPSETSTPQLATQTSSQENDTDEQASKSRSNTSMSRNQTSHIHEFWPDAVGPPQLPAGTQLSDPVRAVATVTPQSPPWVAKRNIYNLPSNLGSSLGNAHTSYHLPSKLGSSLGNTRCGTMHTPPQGLPAVGEESGPASTVEAASLLGAQQQRPDESPRDTPELKPNLSDGAFMDHFQVVPVSEVRALFKLGEGSFGEVLQCSNSLFGQIAVKCAKTEGDKHLFAQEVRMLSSLNHPNVLRFFGVVTKDDSESEIVGIMTEFMQGRSLSHYLKPECKRSSLLQRALLARGAVNGLSYLHKHNIVHFDLKPENLLLDYPLGGRDAILPGIKVADFGLSRYKSDNYASTDSGLRGTVPYMAPEIIVDREHVTEKADIWSLGMVLWEMFTHKVPFGTMEQADIVARLRLGNAYPGIPEDMEQEWTELIDACCRPAPNDRFSLENIAAMLDQIIQQHSPPSPINLY